MVEMDRAVLIDMHQSPCLIEMAERKGTSELDRRERQPLLQHPVVGVPRGHRYPPRAIVRGVHEPLGHLVQDEIRNLLPVGRDLRVHLTRNAFGGARSAGGRQPPSRACGIGVALPRRQRVKPERMGHMIHHPLDAQHALWPAKAAKRGGRGRVGAQPMAFDPHGRQ